jgi:hypothetical protein
MEALIKTWVFCDFRLLIGGNLLYVYAIAPRLHQAGAACPADQPEACTSASRFSRIVLWISAAIYVVGVFSALFSVPC